MINIKAVLPTTEELIKFNNAIDQLASGKMKYYVASEKGIVEYLADLGENEPILKLAHQYIMFKSVEEYIKGNGDEA